MSSLGWVDASSERKKSDLKIYQNKKHLVQKLKLGLRSPYCGNTFSQPHCNDFTTLPYITTVLVKMKIKHYSYLILSHAMTWVEYDPLSSYLVFICRVIIKTEVFHSSILQLIKTKEHFKILV